VSETRISDGFAASGQIGPDDMTAIATRGYRSIICNRPDGEEPGQPSFAAIAEAARAVGLEVAHVPVISGHITEEDVERFRKTVRALPQPIFAYCRSGARCQQLWALST
jgi:uncharacterized protein (TIGR01244 family)